MLLRWKWIFYHFVSSFSAVLICVLILGLWLPGFLPPQGALEGAVLILGAAIISTLSAVMVGFQSSKDIRSQLEEISLGAKNLAYGNLKYRARLSGNPEFDGIILAFNEMAARLESQVDALQKLAEENEQLLQEARITAVSEERQRLARDLHDAVSQQIFAISMLSATAAKIAESKPQQARQLILEISLSANRAQSEMRALLLQLRPITLQNESLGQALKSLGQEFESKQTIRCNLNIDEIELPKNIENQLFRITQEALSNVLRHAEANQVNILLKSSSASSRVLLIIEDNGKGFNLENTGQSTIGLRSIKERATLIGGTAHWISIPGQGTKVEIRVPVSQDPPTAVRSE